MSVTIACNFTCRRPAHPEVQKKLGATIPMEEFLALFPNSNYWAPFDESTWLYRAEREDLQSLSDALSGKPEVIFVDEEGP